MEERRATVTPVNCVLLPANVNQKRGQTDRKRSGRPEVTTESEDKFLRVTSLRDGCEEKTSSSMFDRTRCSRKAIDEQDVRTRLRGLPGSRRAAIGRKIIVSSSRRKDGSTACGFNCQTWRRMCDRPRPFYWIQGRGVRGTLNQNGYHGILQRSAVPSDMRLVGQGFILQQGRGPKHQSKLLPELPDEERTRWWEHGVASTVYALNPIELIWSELDRRVKAKQPTSATHLWNRCEEKH